MMIDKTGQPRTIKEAEGAIVAVTRALFLPTKVPPELFVNLLTIKAILTSYIEARKAAGLE
jgi:hypothetical protein